MKTMFKAALAATSFLAMGGIATAATAQATGGIVTVDVQRVYAECTACKAANTQLQAQGTQLQAYGEQLAAPLRPEGQSLETAVKALNGGEPTPALRQRISAFQAKQDQARTQMQQRQETIQRNRQYVLQQINAKLGPIFTSVMNAHHAIVALDTNAALASSPSIDVTAEVLSQINAQLPTVSATAPTAPAGTSGADGR